jgi:ligand-binding sensor domain-containing protein
MRLGPGGARLEGRPAVAAALIATSLTLPSTALALDGRKALTQYVLESWGPREGLRQHRIASMTQTSDGYLWLATEDGLVRFDGARFTTFDRGNTPALGHNFLYTVQHDAAGSLWAGTYHGLTRLRDGAVTTYTEHDGLTDPYVNCIAVDAAGELWVGGYKGFNHIHGTPVTIERPLTGIVVRQCIAARDGGVWVAAGGALLHLRGATTSERRDLPATGAVTSLLEARDGVLWIGTEGALVRLAGGALRTYTTRDGLSDDHVDALLEDRAGNLWVGTRGGLDRLESGRVSALTSREGLSDDAVAALYEDREGSLWIGTQTGGLDRLADGRCTTYGRREGLSADAVRSVAQTTDGSLWLGTSAGGLDRLHEGRVTVYTTRDGLPSNRVIGLGPARGGELWVGTGGGLARLASGRIRPQAGAPPGAATAAFEDSQGRVWVGTGHGLYRREGDRFVQYAPPDPAVAANAWVGAILEARDGGLWVGTEAGLWRIRGETIQVYRPPSGAAEDFVGSLLEDVDGTLWIGTSLSGLHRLKDGRWTDYGTRVGLLDDGLYAIVDDGMGRLWFTADRGIFFVARQDLVDFAEGRARSVTSHGFDAHDGLRVPEGNGGFPAAVRASDGRLWFATAGGAVVVDPRDLTPSALPPAVHLEEAMVDGVAVPGASGLLLGPGQGKLEVHYTATSLRRPERVRFKVQLEGFDPDWIDAGNRRVAYYTNLPPGRYRFRVAAANEDGPWNEAAASLRFALRPHLYQTTWFRLLGALAAAAMAFAFHRVRVRRLQAREAELARRVEEAVAQVEVLSGLLPICAACKKVRDDRGYWSQIETYIQAHSRAAFSHGICPECMERLYPDYAHLLPGDPPQ